jgi:hypothetical protein
VAQLGARFHGMEEVIGSIPIRSTKSFQAFSRSPPKPFARILPRNGSDLSGGKIYPEQRLVFTDQLENNIWLMLRAV